MVKSLIGILVAALLLAGLAVFEWFFVADQFGDFRAELSALYDKAEEQTANREDANAVKTSWEARKEHLHIWIPHNDITRIDDYLAEAVQLIADADFEPALAKIEILFNLCKALPDTYRPAVENIL